MEAIRAALCFTGAASNMGNRKLIVQDATGLLLHGELGEKLVNSYEFYSAFVSEEEFTLQADGHTLGSLPITRPLVTDQRIIFGGRRWRVTSSDAEKKIISVVPDKGGVPPTFDSAGATVHGRVRNEMRAVLASSDSLLFLGQAGRTLLSEARIV